MAVLLWIHDPAGRDAVVIRNVLTTSNLKAVTEVICSRTPSQIQLIKQHYHSKLGVHLEDDIKRHTSGDHEKVNIFLFLFYLNIVFVSFAQNICHLELYLLVSMFW